MISPVSVLAGVGSQGVFKIGCIPDKEDNIWYQGQ
ncbi:hypothetical protein ES703_69381 [subsurface metagenome]